jgi:uncharacterized OB-fold protein
VEASSCALQDPYVDAFPETRPFWEAAARGEFMLPRRNACGEFHWHPRAHCPFCRADALTWMAVSGTGIVHSYRVVRRGSVPYVLAYVKLVEGPVLMTNIVDCEPQAVRIGLPVKVGFRPTVQGRHTPVIRLA